MKKLSQITESVWGNIRNKSLGNEIRLEDGKKVTTCLGIDVVLKNPECFYDSLIKDILSRTIRDYDVGIVSPKEIQLTPDEMVNVRHWEAPYTFLIYDGLYGTSLVANFTTYEEICENDSDFSSDFIESDYQAICKCVATKLKEINDYFTHVPSDASVIGGDRNDAEKYIRENQLCLISENDMYYWICEYGDDYEPIGRSYIDDFMDSIIAEFPELDDEKFLYWNFSNNGGRFIGLPINFNNVMNIEKYVEFTKRWFNV